MTKNQTYATSVALLTLAGLIWGLSFTCVKWALIDFSTTQLLFWRFVLAFAIGELFLILLYKDAWRHSHQDIFLSFKPGIALGFSLLFQIHGLNFTTATNSGFITSLYVVLIPFISYFLYRVHIQKIHYALAFSAFVGMAFLLDIFSKSRFNYGDFLTVGAALTAAFQILFIGRTAPLSQNSFRYNTYQTFWCLAVVLPFFAYQTLVNKAPVWPAHPSPLSLMGLACLVIFVTLLAFYLQVQAQKIISTTTASMLCLLEAPFSFLFAALLIGEKLAGLQILGAGLILASSAFSVYVDRPNHRHN